MTKNTKPMIKAYIKANKNVLPYFLFLPGYLLAFFLLETFISGDTAYWSSYIFLDDYIPFLEGFVIFYCLWYPFLIVPGLYLFFKDIPEFKRYIWYLICSFAICFAVYIIFPNGQDLRPAVFERDNIFTDIVGLLYSADTNTNVFPSMHVTGALGAAATFFRTEGLKRYRAASLITAVLICASTVFIKQHSLLDVFGGIAVWLISYVVVYRIFSRSTTNR